MKAARVEGRGSEHENGGGDKKGKTQSECGIEDSVTNGFPPGAQGRPERARLHDAGVQIKIVRHNRGAKNAYGDIEHFAVAQDFGARDEADGRFAPKRMRPENFVGETRSNGG